MNKRKSGQGLGNSGGKKQATGTGQIDKFFRAKDVEPIVIDDSSDDEVPVKNKTFEDGAAHLDLTAETPAEKAVCKPELGNQQHINDAAASQAALGARDFLYPEDSPERASSKLDKMGERQPTHPEGHQFTDLSAVLRANSQAYTELGPTQPSQRVDHGTQRPISISRALSSGFLPSVSHVSDSYKHVPELSRTHVSQTQFTKNMGGVDEDSEADSPQLSDEQVR